MNVRQQEPEHANRLVINRFSFASVQKTNGREERVPVLLARPEKVARRLPAVLLLYGTSGTKEGERAWLVDLAKRGIVALAIDARYHGERAPGASSPPLTLGPSGR